MQGAEGALADPARPPPLDVPPPPPFDVDPRESARAAVSSEPQSDDDDDMAFDKAAFLRPPTKWTLDGEPEVVEEGQHSLSKRPIVMTKAEIRRAEANCADPRAPRYAVASNNVGGVPAVTPTPDTHRARARETAQDQDRDRPPPPPVHYLAPDSDPKALAVMRKLLANREPKKRQILVEPAQPYTFYDYAEHLLPRKVDVAKANAYCATLAREWATDASRQLDRAIVLFQMGCLDEAIDEAKEACQTLEMEARRDETHDALRADAETACADLLLRCGRGDEALRRYASAVALREAVACRCGERNYTHLHDLASVHEKLAEVVDRVFDSASSQAGAWTPWCDFATSRRRRSDQVGALIRTRSKLLECVDGDGLCVASLKPRRDGSFGITFGPLSNSLKFVVCDIDESVARQSDLRKDDVVVAVQGQPLLDLTDLAEVERQLEVLGAADLVLKLDVRPVFPSPGFEKRIAGAAGRLLASGVLVQRSVYHRDDLLRVLTKGDADDHGKGYYAIIGGRFCAVEPLAPLPSLAAEPLTRERRLAALPLDESLTSVSYPARAPSSLTSSAGAWDDDLLDDDDRTPTKFVSSVDESAAGDEDLQAPEQSPPSTKTASSERRAAPRKRKNITSVLANVDKTNNKVAPFLSKLSTLVTSVPTAVGGWTADGLSFLVNDELATQYFSYTNVDSFCRQLSCYGFSKTRRRDLSQLDCPSAWFEFRHELFQRDRPELLCQICRMEHLSPSDGSRAAGSDRPRSRARSRAAPRKRRTGEETAEKTAEERPASGDSRPRVRPRVSSRSDAPPPRASPRRQAAEPLSISRDATAGGTSTRRAAKRALDPSEGAQPPPKKRLWEKREDQLLEQAMQPYLSYTRRWPWARIAEGVPGRDGKQCRERWTNHLDPNLNDDPWMAAEDETLWVEQAQLGTKWTEIAGKLPGRSSIDVKNRFYTLSKRKRPA